MPKQKTHAEDRVQQWQRKHSGELKAPFEMPAPLPARTNGRPVILKGNKLKMNKMEDFFKQLVSYLWNSVPRDIVEANSLARFEKGLDIYMNRNDIGSYSN